MSGSAKRRNRSGLGSQASLGMNLNDELEMHEKSRPPSSHSRSAWSDAGGDEIDFSPRAPASAAVDLSVPSAMEQEPVSHQTRVPTDVRAPGTKNVPVGCWTRFKRIIRGKNIIIKAHTRAAYAFMPRIAITQLCYKLFDVLGFVSLEKMSRNSHGNFLRFSSSTFFVQEGALSVLYARVAS